MGFHNSRAPICLNARRHLRGNGPLIRHASFRLCRAGLDARRRVNSDLGYRLDASFCREMAGLRGLSRQQIAISQIGWTGLRNPCSNPFMVSFCGMRHSFGQAQLSPPPERR
jgi:hypothetical protein